MNRNGVSLKPLSPFRLVEIKKMNSLIAKALTLMKYRTKPREIIVYNYYKKRKKERKKLIVQYTTTVIEWGILNFQ